MREIRRKEDPERPKKKKGPPRTRLDGGKKGKHRHYHPGVCMKRKAPPRLSIQKRKKRTPDREKDTEATKHRELTGTEPSMSIQERCSLGRPLPGKTRKDKTLITQAPPRKRGPHPLYIKKERKKEKNNCRPKKEGPKKKKRKTSEEKEALRGSSKPKKENRQQSKKEGHPGSRNQLTPRIVKGRGRRQERENWPSCKKGGGRLCTTKQMERTDLKTPGKPLTTANRKKAKSFPKSSKPFY